MKKLILIDGSSYLFRAYYALPPLNNTNGMATGAIFGVANMLKKLIKENDTDHVVMIFDAKGGSFRNKLYSEYKANRGVMPDDLAPQIQPLHDLIDAMGVPRIVIPGVEADDVIATLTQEALKNKWEVLISTGDKDLTQLVNKHVKIINTMTDTILDEAGVEKKFGVPPKLMLDYLSLIGDSSDNIPGIPGVGPKTATKWLTEYGTLEKLIQNADQIKGKVGESFRNNLKLLDLSRELITLKYDVKLEHHFNDLIINKNIDRDKLKSLLQELGFKKWLEELNSEKLNSSEDDNNKNFSSILNKQDFESLLKNLEKTDIFAFDTETTSLNSYEAELVGISLCFDNDHAYYIPVGHVGHDSENRPEQLELNYVINKLKNIFQNNKISKVAHNFKYDKVILEKYGIEFSDNIFDTMIESYVLNSAGSRHDLDTLSFNYLNRTNIKYEDVTGKGKNKLNFSEVEIEAATPYAAEDAWCAFNLHNILYPKLQEDKKTLEVFTKIDMPLVNILEKIEKHGILLDSNLLIKQSEDLSQKLIKLKQDAFNIANSEFNLDSPKQLQEVLFKNLKIPVVKKTPKGQPSTGVEVLEELAGEYPIARTILEYRSLNKLKTTYTDKLPEQADQKTHRVHTSFHQAVTATGRLSSSDPNLQNIPIRTLEGRKIRQAFIAPQGYKILSCDYSQVELRIMAHLSADEGLIAAFKNNLDIHKATAAQVFNISINEVTDNQRRFAKAINFGLIYGMSAFGLAKQLHIERGEAQKYIDKYFEQYPKILDYMENTRIFAEEHGYVETIFGRRLYLPEIHSKNMMLRKAATRAAINAPMQGTAADLIKLAMIEIDQLITKNFPNNYMVLQVHDELIFECEDKKIDDFIKNIKDLMENTTKLKVPLIVDANVGNNWDEAH